MAENKTSTFTVHHDRCDPGKWTAGDVLTFAKFVKTGNLQHAAALSRLGVQLVLSEHHVPKGGVLEEIGWSAPDVTGGDGISDDLTEIADDLDVTPVVRVYRGPIEYAVKFGIDDGHGEFGGYEYEVKPTEAEANEFLASLTEQADAAGDAGQMMTAPPENQNTNLS